MRILASFVVLAVLMVGCLELSGQRMSLKFDAANDRLLILLLHDGIHDNPQRSKGERERGAEQLQAHLEQGDIMLLDWYGQIERSDIQQLAERETAPPQNRELARRFVEDVAVHAIGHYRSPGGEIGVAQLIVIPEARSFVRQANAAINEGLIHLDASGTENSLRRAAPRSFPGWVADAREGRQWIELRDGAVHLEFDIDRREWAQVKADFLHDAAEYWCRRNHDEGPDDQRPGFPLQLLAASAVSLSERGETISVSIGGTEAWQTMRARIRDTYLPNLEEQVVQSVPADFDRALARSLLGGGTAESTAESTAEMSTELALAVEITPAEDRLRAVLGALDDIELRPAAEAWLRDFATRWNEQSSPPSAPSDPCDKDAWSEWYRLVLESPRAHLR